MATKAHVVPMAESEAFAKVPTPGDRAGVPVRNPEAPLSLTFNGALLTSLVTTGIDPIAALDELVASGAVVAVAAVTPPLLPAVAA